MRFRDSICAGWRFMVGNRPAVTGIGYGPSLPGGSVGGEDRRLVGIDVALRECCVSQVTDHRTAPPASSTRTAPAIQSATWTPRNDGTRAGRVACSGTPL